MSPSVKNHVKNKVLSNRSVPRQTTNQLILDHKLLFQFDLKKSRVYYIFSGINNYSGECGSLFVYIYRAVRLYFAHERWGCTLAVGRVCSGVVYLHFRYNNKGQNDSYRCNRARLYSVSTVGTENEKKRILYIGCL